jgi:hypothetical protein
MARLFDIGGSPAVHAYMFALTPNFIDDKFAPHDSELPYVFGMFPNTTVSQGEVGQAVASFWSDFAISADGDPNPKCGAKVAGAGNVFWPKFTMEGDKVLRFEGKETGGIQPQQGLRKEACDWQTEFAFRNPKITPRGLQTGPVPGLKPYN